MSNRTHDIKAPLKMKNNQSKFKPKSFIIAQFVLHLSRDHWFMFRCLAVD